MYTSHVHIYIFKIWPLLNMHVCIFLTCIDSHQYVQFSCKIYSTALYKAIDYLLVMESREK